MLVLLFLGRLRLVGLILQVKNKFCSTYQTEETFNVQQFCRVMDPQFPTLINQQNINATLGFLLDIVPAILLTDTVPPLLLQAKQCQA